MFPVREAESGEDRYHQQLALIRERILAFARRRLVPGEADFADAEEIAQSCIVVLWERYPEKRDLAEMTAIAIGTARHKIAQFRRDRDRLSRAAAEAPRAPPKAICSSRWPRAKRRTGSFTPCCSFRPAAANCCG